MQDEQEVIPTEIKMCQAGSTRYMFIKFKIGPARYLTPNDIKMCQVDSKRNTGYDSK